MDGTDRAIRGCGREEVDARELLREDAAAVVRAPREEAEVQKLHEQ